MMPKLSPHRCARVRANCTVCGPMLSFIASGAPHDAVDAGGALLATMLAALEAMETGRINDAANMLRRPLRHAGLKQWTACDDPWGDDA